MGKIRALWVGLVDKIRRVRRNEPVRLFFQTYSVLILGMATTAGVISDNHALWITLAGAAILGVPAGEMVRKRVTPVTKTQEQIGSVIDTVNEVLRERWHDDQVYRGLKDVKSELRAVAGEYEGKHRA